MPSAAATRTALSGAPVSRTGMASLVSSFGALHLHNASRSQAAAAAASAAAASSAVSCRCHRRFYHSQRLPPASRSSRASSSSAYSSASSSSFSSSPLRRPFLPSGSSSSSVPQSAVAFFSTTAARPSLKSRRLMREWYDIGLGNFWKPRKALKRDDPNWNQEDFSPRPTRRPFPYNKQFSSTPVLSERLREQVWDKVTNEGESIKAVAAEYSIDMRRVAAVVRLKQIEKAWMAEGKPLAKPYAQAVLSMLPQTDLTRGGKAGPHEPINEIHVHRYTQQQLFVPVSESRHFTREDAAHAFHPTLLPADKRMPIPELVALERDVTKTHTRREATEVFRTRVAAEQAALAARDKAAADAEAARTQRVATERFEFRIRDIDAEDVGKDGRSPRAVGWRYGVPFHDRKRGQVKIPTSVG
ncbi:Ribosomal protein S35, mitochondrial [Niveomyces insectorum RCEF 264]|uniref:Ribosomal protein S35, mitochondrial n=1 Tax=Niveomyces insectorum RCEF 264 TaxID=1081102 RepID=A0A167W9S9_9HYPO|nr:Ribosomal protein S35, mitochondrial [Niveomyces insectorum RCEF 264]